MTEQIEKPWAVYPSGIGRVVREDSDGKIWVASFETNSPAWVPEKVRTFKSPKEALFYFLDNQPYNPHYSLTNIARMFIDQFPSESKSIENLLEQSSPKCTIGRGHGFCSGITCEKTC